MTEARWEKAMAFDFLRFNAGKSRSRFLEKAIMTDQRPDFLFVDGERYPIRAAAPCPFVPGEYNLRYGGWHSTACYRGFYVDFELLDRELRIRELYMVAHPQDQALLAAGQLFGHKPAEVTGANFVFRDVPFSYSGRLLVNTSDRKATQEKPLLLAFELGQLTTRQELALGELPKGLFSSSSWVEYGDMMWLHVASP